MELGNKWNNQYLLEGRVTTDMKPLEEEIRLVRRKMLKSDVEDCRLALKEYNGSVQHELVAQHG